jgi:hypothetical protein
MDILLIEKILPIYHKAPKKRHDLLCDDLASISELKGISVETISLCVKEIETVISNSVGIARDEMYGAIDKIETIEKIRKIFPTKNQDSLDILFDRAHYYACR